MLFVFYIKLIFASSNFFHSGTTNLMGKFTQSVRRIVQDVKDEGTMSREDVIDTNERLRTFRFVFCLSIAQHHLLMKHLVKIISSSKYFTSKLQSKIPGKEFFQGFIRFNLLLKINV